MMEQLGQQRRAYEAAPKAVLAEELRPSGSAPVLGGKAKLRTPYGASNPGLPSTPAANLVFEPSCG